MSSKIKASIAKSLLSKKEYRDAFVRQLVTQGVGLQIREVRKSLNLNQSALSKKIGNSGQPEISRWEKGEVVPSLTTLLKLASAFDVGLVVTFVPFSEIVDFAESRTTEKNRPVTLAKDAALRLMASLHTQSIPRPAAFLPDTTEVARVPGPEITAGITGTSPSTLRAVPAREKHSTPIVRVKARERSRLGRIRTVSVWGPLRPR